MIQFALRIFFRWNHQVEKKPFQNDLKMWPSSPKNFVVDSACLPGLSEVLVYELNTEVWKNRQEIWLW